MKKKNVLLPFASMALIGTMLNCTDIKYDSPIDINGTNKDQLLANPGSILDTINGGNGVADYFDDPGKFQPKDLIPPVITLLDGDTVEIEFGDPDNRLKYFTDTAISVSDNSGPTIKTSVENSVDIYAKNADTFYTIKYIYSDSSNNSDTAIRYVSIYTIDIDKKPPVITVGELTKYVQVNTEFVDPGVSVYDNHDKQIPSSKVAVSGTVNMKVVGTYILTYTVSDSAGNVGTATRKVVVQTEPPEKDRKNPVVTLIGADSVFVPDKVLMENFYKTYKDAGYKAYDSVDGDLHDKVKVSALLYQSPKIWYITFDVADAAGNSAPTVKRIFVTTNTDVQQPPYIELRLGDSIITLVLPASGKAVWKEPGYQAFDAKDTGLTKKVVVDSADLVAHLDKKGTYFVTYSVTNSSNLPATKKRQVDIVDNIYDVIKPVITILGRNPDTALAKDPKGYVDPKYKAEDNRDGDLTASVKTSGTVNINTMGKYTLTYSVTDKAGLTGTATRVVWVVRDTAAKDLLTAFVVPTDSALPALLQKTYKSIQVTGEGAPDTANIDFLRIAWDPTQNAGKGAINEFAIQKKTGNPTYVSMSNVTHTFGSPKPTLTIANANLPDFKGTYYVTVIGKEFIWVEKTGKFAIVWGP